MRDARCEMRAHSVYRSASQPVCQSASRRKIQIINSKYKKYKSCELRIKFQVTGFGLRAKKQNAKFKIVQSASQPVK
jgi:hypothetical protein